MKNKIKISVCALALAAALIQPQPVAGQNTQPVTLADMKGQLMLLQDNIATAVASLEQVKASEKDEAALAKALAGFQSAYQALETQAGTVRTQAVVAKARANEQYELWQKDLATVQNPSIREKAQDRFAESKKEFDKIIEKAAKAKEEATPFVAELKDLTIYFQADPSAGAVKSLSNTIWKLNNKSKSVIGSITDVTEQIDRTIKSLPKK
jgi:hypothetical protein